VIILCYEEGQQFIQ